MNQNGIEVPIKENLYKLSHFFLVVDEPTQILEPSSLVWSVPASLFEIVAIPLGLRSS